MRDLKHFFAKNESTGMLYYLGHELAEAIYHYSDYLHKGDLVKDSSLYVVDDKTTEIRRII